MKYLFVLVLFFSFSKNSFGQVKTGDKYGGVVKATMVAAKNNVNGKWNTGDNTGNGAVDATLDKYATANKTNLKAIVALENAAAEIKANPEKFINPDGSINKDALNILLSQKFDGAGNVTVPSPPALVDSNTNKSIRNR